MWHRLGENCQNLSCIEGFEPDDLQRSCIATCFGVNAKLPHVCSTHGECIMPNVCNCTIGYSGKICDDNVTQSVANCFGIADTSNLVCSTHGKCTMFNTCICDEGWEGVMCEMDNITSGCETGYVFNQDQAICEPICFGVPASTRNVCTGHGLCNEPNSCQCATNFTGAQCENALNDVRECFGLVSSDPAICNGHGLCLGMDTCSCNETWYGLWCEKRYCSCSLGECQLDGSCLCQLGWAGPTCSVPLCNGILASDPLVCSGNGHCIAPEICSCLANYLGAYCSIPTCLFIPSNHPFACSGHGQCSFVDNCSCADGWTGKYCERSMCGCSGHGFCTTDTMDACNCTCDCLTGWYGTQCQYAICNSLTNLDPAVCNGRGNCHHPTRPCFCERNRVGFNCEESVPFYTHSCFGIPSTHPQSCNAHGQCISQNVCYCAQGFGGVECENTVEACDDLPCPCFAASGAVYNGTRVCTC